MKNSRSGEKIKLTSIDELLGVVNEESAMEIEIKSISPFKGHPFKVIADDKMEELINSVKESGVITPVLLRPAGENHYEMISGHRRMYAARKAGLSTVPAIVRDMTDDEAVIAMVDANIQREELLPSEKAFAYKMKLNAMKRQAGRPSKNRGCRKIIKLDDRVTPSLNLKGKTEVISPVLWLTSVFWRTLIKIFVFSIFKQVFSQEINVFLFGHSVFSREVY